MSQSKAFALAWIIEVVLIYMAGRVGRHKLDARSRVFAWVVSAWIVTGMLAVQYMIACQGRWVSLPPFFGVNLCTMATSVDILIAAVTMERVLSHISVLQNGELPLIGTALALPVASYAGDTAPQVAVLFLLALFAAILVAIRCCLVPRPTLPTESGDMESEGQSDGWEIIPCLEFVKEDRSLVALLIAYFGVLLGVVVVPGLVSALVNALTQIMG